MKFLKSYPCQIEYIQQLPLDVLEDIMIRIGDDSYLDKKDKALLLDLYIEQRWRKKQKSFIYSKDNISRIEKINQMLIRQTTDVMTSAWEIYKQEKEENERNGKKYGIEIIPMLLTPNRMFGFLANNFTHKEAKIWWILVNGYNGSKENDGNILPPAGEYGLWKEELEFEEKLKIKLWGFSGFIEPDKEETIIGLDHEKTNHIRFCCPFYYLLSLERLALEDVLKIEKFIPKIEVRYEAL